MTEELNICEIKIAQAAGRSDSDSQMMSFEVIMPLKLQSTKKALLCAALHCLGWQIIRENE